MTAGFIFLVTKKVEITISLVLFDVFIVLPVQTFITKKWFNGKSKMGNKN